MSNENEPAVGSMDLGAMISKTIDNPFNKGAEAPEPVEELTKEITLEDPATPKPDPKKKDKQEEEQDDEEEEDNDPPGGKTAEIDKDEEEVSEDSEMLTDALKNILGDEFSDIVMNVNGEEVPLDKINMDMDTFKEVIQDHIKVVEERSSQGKVSLEKISQFTKDLIEIEKNGGDISPLLKKREDFGDPLDKVDLTTVSGQKEAIRLRLKASKQSDDQINRLIKSYEADGELEEYANAAHDELKTWLEAQTQAHVEHSHKLVEHRKEVLKKFKKELKENLSDFELKDPLKNKIVDLATREDSEGSFHMDNLFKEWRSDPKKAARLALFLLDEKEFIKQVTNAAVIDSKLTSAKKRVIVRRDPSGGSGSPKQDNKSVSSVDLMELKNR